MSIARKLLNRLNESPMLNQKLQTTMQSHGLRFNSCKVEGHDIQIQTDEQAAARGITELLAGIRTLTNVKMTQLGPLYFVRARVELPIGWAS